MVTDFGVACKYNILEEAKEALNSINTGNRFIAEVSSEGILKKNPHMINGQSQTKDNGFNKFWCGWDCINRMVDVCQKYLESTGK